MSIRSLRYQNYNGPTRATPDTGFPGAYTSLIDSYSGSKYYIDAATGSDANPGTENAPLSTYAGFRTITSSTTTPVMAIFKTGTYTLSSIISNASYSECCFTDEGYERVFVCQPGKVKFIWLANGGKRDAGPFWFRHANSRVYGGIVQRNNNSRTTSYSVAWFNDETSKFAGKIYNTVVEELNANGNWALSYKNSGVWADTQGPYYCTFVAPGNALSSYSGGGSFYGDRCVGSGTSGLSSSAFTNYVNASGAINSTTYYAAGASGVYQGTYAWSLPS